MAIINEPQSIYRSHDQIVTALIAQIKLREPLWATEPGTPLRKLIDAFAAMLEQITLDAFFAQISWDLESKSGTDLDEFVAIFGFERKAATKATGFVKYFSADPSGAPQRFTIPQGARSATAPASGGQSLVFLSTTSVVLELGALQVEVPVEAEAAGSTYNVEAGTIVIEASGLPGIGGDNPVRNDNATTGGSDIESDQALRERFRRTIFRNIAGSREAYIGVADRNEFVTANRVAVYAQTNRREDVLQFSAVDEGGNAWPGGDVRAYLPRTNLYFESELVSPLDSAVIPEDRTYYTRYTDYVILTDLTGSYLLALIAGSIEDGQLVVANYEYRPTVSRADEFGNTRNVVDVYVGGSERQSSVDLVTMDTSSLINVRGRLLATITSSQTTVALFDLADNFPVQGVIQIESEYIKYTGRTLNVLTGCTRGVSSTGVPAGSVAATHAINLDVLDVTNRYFSKLMFQPVDDLSDTIVQGTNVFREGVDYQILKDDNGLGNAGSWRARDGIAWERSAVAPGQNEKQQIFSFLQNAKVRLSRTAVVTGGTFVLNYNMLLTAAINWNATAANVKTALQAVTGGAATLSVTGGPLPNTAVDIEYTGAQGNKPQTLLIVDNALVVGTGEFKIDELQAGHGLATAGTWTLESDGNITNPMQWNASNATIEGELELLASINGNNVQLTGGPLPGTPVNVEWINALAQQPQPTLVTASQLTNGGDYEVLETQDGHGAIPSQPVDDSQFRIDYVFDKLPKDLYDQYYTAPVRNITADVLAHSGKEIFFGINLAVMYDNKIPAAQVNAQIEQLLTAYVEALGFGSTIQLQDFIDTAYNAGGIDNVRFVQPSEAKVDFGIRIFGPDGNTSLYRGRKNYITDFILEDDEIPVLQLVNFIQRAQNSWNRTH